MVEVVGVLLLVEMVEVAPVVELVETVLLITATVFAIALATVVVVLATTSSTGEFTPSATGSAVVDIISGTASCFYVVYFYGLPAASL